MYGWILGDGGGGDLKECKFWEKSWEKVINKRLCMGFDELNAVIDDVYTGHRSGLEIIKKRKMKQM
jgi:hypothetical protein